jgi:O-antigen ligase
MIGAATLYPRLYEDHYRTSVHAVTAIKFAEYGVLALALPLLVRGVDDLVLPFVTVVAWSAAATVVGITQFFGASYLEAWAAGRRQPSFLGHHDFAALSGATLSLALAAVAFGSVWRPPRALVVVAGLAGGLGLVVSGSTAGGIGLLAAAAAAALIAHKRFGLTLQRAGVLAAIAGVVFLGIIVLRGRDFDQFLRFVGVEPEQQTTRAGVQTYAQRTILSYIGLKIFLDHPVAGVGWEGSGDQEAYGPQLAAARAKFPDANPLAFPSPAHAYGVQNGWVQALADLGLIGFACFAALYLSGLLVGSGAALRAPPDFAVVGLVAVLWLLVTMGVWTAVGLVAGLPQDALLWTALGLAVVASAGARRAAG